MTGPALATCSGGFVTAGSVGSKWNDYLHKACFAPVPNLAQGAPLSNLAPTSGPGNQTYVVGRATGSGDKSPASVFGFGTRNIARGPFEQRLDKALTRDIRLRESRDLQLRAEAFKLFNNPIFANPRSTNISTSTFGVITSTVDQTGRILQFAAKFSF